MASEKEQILSAFVSGVWKVISYVYKYPQHLLYGWGIGWGFVLLATLVDNGPGPAVLLITSGVLNISSVIGLAIPMFALSLMFAEYIIPATWDFFENAFYRIFRKVKKEFEEAYNKIKEVIEAISKGIKDLIEKIKDLSDKITEFFNKIGGGITDGAKDVGNKIKDGLSKLFGTELQAIQESHQSLLGHLDRLDKLAPEEKSFTDSIRQMSSEAVSVVDSPFKRTDTYLGGELRKELSALYSDMMGQVKLVKQNLLQDPK